LRWQELTRRLKEIRDRIPLELPSTEDPALLREVWQAHGQLHCLESQFDYVDRDMVDYLVFRINAAEHLCATLWQAARREKVTAWGDLPNPVCTEPWFEAAPGRP